MCAYANDLTSISSALLTPVIAIIALYVAYAQWRTARNKLKLDLFDRRFVIYEAVRKIIGNILVRGNVDDKNLFEFLSGMHASKWLFDDSVAEYFEKGIYHKLVDLQTLEHELPGLTGVDRSDNIKKQAELKKWLSKQYDVIDRMLKRYLYLQH